MRWLNFYACHTDTDSGMKSATRSRLYLHAILSVMNYTNDLVFGHIYQMGLPLLVDEITTQFDLFIDFRIGQSSYAEHKPSIFKPFTLVSKHFVFSKAQCL